MKRILPWFFILTFCVTLFAENVTFDKCWSRSGDVSLTAAEQGYQLLTHTGSSDFCANAPLRIPVQPGDLVTLSCDMKTEGEGSAGVSVILYRKNEVVTWSYGGQSIQNTGEKKLVSQFLIPGDVDAIVPRVIGAGAEKVWFKNCQIQKTGSLPLVTKRETLTLENAFLKLEFSTHNGAFSVRDKRTDRLWGASEKGGDFFVLKAEKRDDSLYFEAISTAMLKFNVTIRLEKELPECVVVIDGASEQTVSQLLRYPMPFLCGANDRIILPINEGFSYPAAGKVIGPSSLYTYGGHGLCMGFWGVSEDVVTADGEVTGGAAYLGIFETPDDSGLEVRTLENDRLGVTPWWGGQLGKWGYARTLRLVFQEKGGHVALAKRYREYAKKIGLYVPFTEKVRRNPALKGGIDRLIGAANIWYFGNKKIEMYQELQAAGITRVLASSGGSPEEVRWCNEQPTFLSCRYDIYQDIMNPEKYDAIGFRHWPHMGKAWPNDLNWNENLEWRKGWAVDNKDKTQPRIPCGVLCDSKALPYAEAYISEELKTKPFLARFLDTTVASPWRECYHPDHPMTRTQSKEWKMKLLGLLGERFHLVCGSETGHEASVPYCDFYEGMMSLGPFRVPDSGRNLMEIWDVPPEKTEKYQVGEAYRLPLWELVYHDCTVSYWYWGDYNNKLPSLWAKRDLFNALYGVPPMYLFDRKRWEQNKARFVESYQIAQPVSRRTGYSEMTDHRILTPDRTVQQTRFANGTVVTVNFGNSDFTLKDGTIIPAGKSLIK
ncbi:MAG: glycoside hydrolase [Planctomycetia bacterium]|nr:glycoside hydrolase [Planctomycetia bacterium]